MPSSVPCQQVFAGLPDADRRTLCAAVDANNQALDELSGAIARVMGALAARPIPAGAPFAGAAPRSVPVQFAPASGPAGLPPGGSGGAPDGQRAGQPAGPGGAPAGAPDGQPPGAGGSGGAPAGTVDRKVYQRMLDALKGINTYIGQVTGAINSVPVQPAPAKQPATAMEMDQTGVAT